jgi:hypothetical protein
MQNRNRAKPPKAGAFEVVFINEVPSIGFDELLIALRDDSDPRAQRSAEATLSWLSRYHRARAKPDCSVCGSRLVSLPATLLIMLPLRSAGRRAVVGGICPSCHALPRADLMARAMRTITRMWPSARLRAATPVHGGRA